MHVFGDGHARINLIGPHGEPELVWAEGMKRNDVRRAMDVVIERQMVFLAQWRKMHD